MSYKTQALLAKDENMIARVTACAALEGIFEPYNWTFKRTWQLSAQPGWDAAYAYAITANVDNPGNDEGVITDGMILSAVQSMLATTES